MANILDIPNEPTKKLMVSTGINYVRLMKGNNLRLQRSRGKVHWAYVSGAAINTGDGVVREYGEQGVNYVPQNTLMDLSVPEFSTDDGPLENVSIAQSPTVSSKQAHETPTATRGIEFSTVGSSTIPWNGETISVEPTGKGDMESLGTSVANKVLDLIEDCKGKMPFTNNGNITVLTSTSIGAPSSVMTGNLSFQMECTPDIVLSGGVWGNKARISALISENWPSACFFVPLIQDKLLVSVLITVELEHFHNSQEGAEEAQDMVLNAIQLTPVVDFMKYSGTPNQYSEIMTFSRALSMTGTPFNATEGTHYAWVNESAFSQPTGKLFILRPRLEWGLPSAQSIVANTQFLDLNATKRLSFGESRAVLLSYTATVKARFHFIGPTGGW